MWRLSRICKHKHLNSKYIRLTTCFSNIARGKEGSSSCLLISPDSCSRICNFSAFGHKTWNAICPTTCLEMDLFQFSCGICGDVFFSGFANPCPTICRDDFHPNITVNNRGSAELVHPCSKLSENHCKFASEMGVCKKWMNLSQTSRSSYFQLI